MRADAAAIGTDLGICGHLQSRLARHPVVPFLPLLAQREPEQLDRAVRLRAVTGPVRHLRGVTLLFSRVRLVLRRW